MRAHGQGLVNRFDVRDGRPDSASLPTDDHGRLVVFDPHLLFCGHYTREGLNLVITDADRHVVLRDYFKVGGHKDLVAPDGAILSATIVDAMVGHGEFAQAAPGAATGKVIGTVVKLTGSATAIRN